MQAGNEGPAPLEPSTPPHLPVGTCRVSDSGCHLGGSSVVGGESCPPAWIPGALPAKTDDVISDCCFLCPNDWLEAEQKSSEAQCTPGLNTCLWPQAGQRTGEQRGPGLLPTFGPGSSTDRWQFPPARFPPVGRMLFPRPGCQRSNPGLSLQVVNGINVSQDFGCSIQVTGGHRSEHECLRKKRLQGRLKILRS